MSDPHPAPRIVIAGLSGDSGKTLVSIGLLLLARRINFPVAAFKKGPDYIDAAWLTWAAGRPARNLDTYLMGFDNAVRSFACHAAPDGLNLIEGNRGLFDGVDALGTHSSAELAKALRAPAILVLNATKVTRTAAALVLGCQKLDPDLDLRGVILNQVAGRRHESVLRDAIESTCGIPVLGALPRAGGQAVLPSRHLGLVTPAEHGGMADLEEAVLEIVRERLDLDRIMTTARSASPLGAAGPIPSASPDSPALRIGIIRDSAFNFYYPENLEALEAAGATLVPVSALDASELPRDISGLYIGGGFPETHGARLSANRSFLAGLKRSAEDGLPIYAECGGLMLMSRAVLWQGKRHAMAGFLPFDVAVHETPRGHGYTRLTVDQPNPFYSVGLAIRGHEFHYSSLASPGDLPQTVCAVSRGSGCGNGRDGIVLANTWASYTHVHALGTPEWAPALVSAARRNRPAQSQGPPDFSISPQGRISPA